MPVVASKLRVQYIDNNEPCENFPYPTTLTNVPRSMYGMYLIFY